MKIRFQRNYCRWFSFNRYWSGRIWNITAFKVTLVLDFRRNWLADMAGNKGRSP